MMSLWKWFIPGLCIGGIVGTQLWRLSAPLPQTSPLAVVSPAKPSLPSDFPAAFAEAKTNYEKALSIIDWAERSPNEAWEWAFNELTGDVRDEALSGMIYRIGERDPDWAWERALSLPKSNERVNLLAQRLSALAEHDPSKAREWLLSFPPSVECDYLLSGLVAPLLNKPANALALIQELHTMPLDDKQGRSTVLYDPNGARTSTFPGPRNSLSRTANDLVMQLGEDNPKEALAWIGRLKLKSDHARSLIQRWYERSPEQVQEWIDQAPTEISNRLPKSLTVQNHEE